MTHFRISDAADLLGVSGDTVRRWAANDRLATRQDERGRVVIDGKVLADFARELAAQPQPAGMARESARNRLRGIVTHVVTDTVMAQVEIQAGPHRVVSLMSREAVEELGLEAGVLVVASVKATNVVVEMPQP